MNFLNKKPLGVVLLIVGVIAVIFGIVCFASIDGHSTAVVPDTLDIGFGGIFTLSGIVLVAVGIAFVSAKPATGDVPGYPQQPYVPAAAPAPTATPASAASPSAPARKPAAPAPAESPENEHEYEYVTLGAYKQGDGRKAIEWRVLAKKEGKALLVSRYALDFQPYNVEKTNVTWETCSLRQWLNGTFFRSAFSPEEQERILSTTVPAGRNPMYSTSPGNDTTDKVFLLSITEANKYFRSVEERKCAPTKYAATQGAYTNPSNGNCWWWLRSPGNYSFYAAFVSSGGSVSNDGDRVHLGAGAVRPALWIDLGS